MVVRWDLRASRDLKEYMIHSRVYAKDKSKKYIRRYARLY